MHMHALACLACLCPHTLPLLSHPPPLPSLQAFPERVYDVGIAEQHAVTFAAGMACEGLAPFVAIYSSFMQRGYDQVVHDVSLQNLPGGRAGGLGGQPGWAAWVG